MAEFSSKFAFGDAVSIVGDGSIKAMVVGFQFRMDASNPIVQISYFHNGDLKEPWVYEWQIASCDD